MTRVRAFLAWLWKWITVVTAIVIGALPLVIEALDQITAAGVPAFVDPATAAKIISAVAVVKVVATLVLAVARRE